MFLDTACAWGGCRSDVREPFICELFHTDCEHSELARKRRCSRSERLARTQGSK